MAATNWIEPIERAAEALLAAHQSTPVPVEAIATDLALLIEPTALADSVSGILVVSTGRGVIGVNKSHSFRRQRFTIAHEIGHYVLHRDQAQLFIDKDYRVFFRDERPQDAGDLRERDANAFAAALLMPRARVSRIAKSHHFELGDEDGPVLELAKMFEVSSQAMTYRLANLGILGTAARR